MPRQIESALVALVALVAIFFTVKTYFGASGPPASRLGGGGPAMLAGAPAQSYPVKTLAGAIGGLDRYRGHVVLVNLWASWCAPCRTETPDLERLFEADRGKGLVVLGIDQGESPAAAGAFIKEMHVSYPVLLDEDQQYGRAYAAIGLPTSLVVDRSGHIVRGVDGPMSLAEMHAAVDALVRAPQ
jgi:thiol-disulfide isomerase/thioredoxin